jgi:hypothetical protein
MKTYKQLYQKLRNENVDLRNQLQKAIESQVPFNPVKYQEMEDKLATCIEGLEAIEAVEKVNTPDSKTTSRIIAEEVLYQIGRK